MDGSRLNDGQRKELVDLQIGGLKNLSMAFNRSMLKSRTFYMGSSIKDFMKLGRVFNEVLDAAEVGDMMDLLPSQPVANPEPNRIGALEAKVDKLIDHLSK
jgi:hypothetical protein|tara:strand:- start:123 stop:425 length:303 start_codon:yes stop_codon:yes gene_type:complete